MAGPTENDQALHPDVDLTDERWRERVRAVWFAEVPPDMAERAVQWITEKWGDPPPACPFCGTNSWAVGERLVVEQGWATDSVRPMLPVTCDNC
jgi:hypothetical protein